MCYVLLCYMGCMPRQMPTKGKLKDRLDELKGS